MTTPLVQQASIGSPWQDMTGLGGSWVPYDGGFYYAPPQYRMDQIGRVFLRGTIKSGSTGINLFTLPQAYWPDYQLTFYIAASGGGARVDITTLGQVQIVTMTGTNAYVCLDNVEWLAASAPLLTPWTNITLSTGWSTYGSTFASARYCVDIAGYVHLGGLIKGDTSTRSGTIGTATPASWTDSGSTTYITECSGGSCRIDVSAAGVVLLFAYNYQATNTGYQFVSLDGIVYRTSAAKTSYHLTLDGGIYQNSWANYDTAGTTWVRGGWVQDETGLIRTIGLIRAGTAASIWSAMANRPAYAVVNVVGSNNSYEARVDVAPQPTTGTMILVSYNSSGNNTYVTLSGPRWLPGI